MQRNTSPGVCRLFPTEMNGTGLLRPTDYQPAYLPGDKSEKKKIHVLDAPPPEHADCDPLVWLYAIWGQGMELVCLSCYFLL